VVPQALLGFLRILNRQSEDLRVRSPSLHKNPGLGTEAGTQNLSGLSVSAAIISHRSRAETGGMVLMSIKGLQVPGSIALVESYSKATLPVPHWLLSAERGVGDVGVFQNPGEG